MSRLVRVWEGAYEFNEDELAFFAETQRQLSNEQGICKIPSQQSNREQWQRYASEICIKSQLDSLSLTTSSSMSASIIPEESRELYERLKRRVILTEGLCDILQQLSTKLSEIRKAHDQVKSKSLVMQSIWESLVERQASYTETINGLSGALKPYVRYERLAEILSKHHQETSSKTDAIQEASLYLKQIISKPEHKDSQLYAARYRQLLTMNLQEMALYIEGELDHLTKTCSLRLKGGVTLELLADINADHLILLDQLRNKTILLCNVGDSLTEFSQYAHTVIRRYFACRSSLLHHFFSAWTGKDGSTSWERLAELIELAMHVLGEEKILFERLISVEHFPSHAIQYRQLVETFLLPILKRIKLGVEGDDNPSKCHATAFEMVDRLNGSNLTNLNNLNNLTNLNDDQRRFLKVLRDYLNHSAAC